MITQERSPASGIYMVMEAQIASCSNVVKRAFSTMMHTVEYASEAELPPPRKVLRRGTSEIKEAMRKGRVVFSLPQPELSAWLEEAKAADLPYQNAQTVDMQGESRIALQENWVLNDDSSSNLPNSVLEQIGDIVPVNDYGSGHDQTPNADDRQAPSSNTSSKLEANTSPTKRRAASKSSSDPNVTMLSDIIGHAAVKLRIEEVLLPIALPPQLADSILTGIRSLSPSILLYGPPGCGKTKLAKAIAGEAQAAFLPVGPSDILSKFVGESEASVRSLFDRAYEQAKNAVSKCAVLFFDEIDALGQSRGEPGSASSQQSTGGDVCSRRVLAEILIQMNRINAPRANATVCPEQTPEQGRVEEAFDADSIDSEYESGEDHEVYPEHTSCNEDDSEKCTTARVIVVAATNRPEDCDPALIRRFAIRVLVGPPSKRDRVKILTRFLQDLEHTLAREHLDYLAKSTEGWTGSDLESLSREAAMAPVRECIRSAALLKRRARRREQRGGDTSSQHEGMARMDPHDEARDHLLEKFQALRPVSLEDFQTAITFWEEQHFSGGQPSHLDGTGMPGRSVHYDTSSDEED